jgi:hypothetical protein
MPGAERIRWNASGHVARPWRAALEPYQRASAYDFFVLEQTLKIVSSDAGLVAHATESVVKRWMIQVVYMLQWHCLTHY